MQEYTVYFSTTAETSIKVEAEDIEEAIEKAYEKEFPTLSANASGWGQNWWLELSDVWEPNSVEYEDENGDIKFKDVK